MAIVPEKCGSPRTSRRRSSRMKIGQPVEIHVDAYPDEEFRGHVDSVQAGGGRLRIAAAAECDRQLREGRAARCPVQIVFDEATARSVPRSRPRHVGCPHGQGAMSGAEACGSAAVAGRGAITVRGSSRSSSRSRRSWRCSTPRSRTSRSSTSPAICRSAPMRAPGCSPATSSPTRSSCPISGWLAT